jgi:hypothetical protein
LAGRREPVAASGKSSTVLLYGKPDCHLCDDAAAILTALSRQMPISWQKVNITGDPALYERFQYRIPVIELPDGQTLDWPTTAERVRRALQVAARS